MGSTGRGGCHRASALHGDNLADDVTSSNGLPPAILKHLFMPSVMRYAVRVSGARRARHCSGEIIWVGNFDLQLSWSFNRGAFGIEEGQAVHGSKLRQFSDLANRGCCSVLLFVLDDKGAKTRTWWAWTAAQIQQPTTTGPHLAHFAQRIGGFSPRVVLPGGA